MTQPSLNYPPDTAGAIMSTDFIAVPEDLTVEQTIERIRSAAQTPGRATYVYVVDAEKSLRGVLFLRDLIFNPPSKSVREIAFQKLVAVDVLSDQEEVARIFQKHKFMALPVVEDHRIVGTISAENITKVVQEEATEDILKVAGIAGGEESFKSPMQTSIRSRLPWLALNIFLDVIAVSVIAYFESTLQEVIALAVILPIISDMGGNVGIQTVSIAVRGLASGEISFKDFRKIIGREFGVGFLNGLVLGILLGVIGYLWKGNIVLGVVAGFALWINTIVAGIAGAAIPLLLKKRNLDPATGSGALLTTITDISGFFLALSLATYLVPYLK